MRYYLSLPVVVALVFLSSIAWTCIRIGIAHDDVYACGPRVVVLAPGYHAPLQLQYCVVYQ